MCLAIPMRVLQVDGLTARCDARGTERSVSLLLLQDQGVRPGDFVVVHMGSAMQTLPAEEAQAVWALYDEMLAAEAARAQP